MTASVLIPAYGEAAALPAVLAELLPLLPDDCQIVVAAEDDNNTGGRDSGIGCPTGQAAARVGDPRVTVCDGGGGLIGGLLEAANTATHPWVVVMDGDGQHDPQTVAALAGMAHDRLDVAVGGTVRTGLSRPRKVFSHVATATVRLRLAAQVNATVKYPLSGLFATRRSLLIEALAGVSPQGFKALLAVLSANPDGRVQEIPSVLRERSAGTSKLSWPVIRADLSTLVSVHQLRRRAGDGVTHPDSVRFKAPWREWRQTVTARRVLIGVLAAVATVVLLVPFWPFLTAPTWPTVVDLGGHRVPMREWGGWLAEGRTIGWDHSWFNGYPIYQFYFPGGWFIWQAFNIVLPEITAYRLMTAAAYPATVLAVWWLGRTWGLTLARAGVLAACVPVGFVLVRVGTDTVSAGLYAHHWSVVFGLVYLAALNKSGHRWGTWPLVGFLSLTAAFLSHPYPAVSIGAASLLLLPRVGWTTFVKGTLLAAGLTAWWWLPFITHLDLAYLDMTRWHPSWSEILMRDMLIRGFVSLFDVLSWMSPVAVVVLASVGAVFVLGLAAVGGWRLARTVPDRRVLWPFAAMMALPVVNRLMPTLGVAEGVSEFVGFQGGRLFFVWFMAVPALALYTVVDLARDTNPKFRTVRADSVVSLTLVVVAALVAMPSLGAVGSLLPNTSSRFNVPPASVDASVETSTWFSATTWVANDRSSAGFYPASADTGRNVAGVHRESSPAARFVPAIPLPEWVRDPRTLDRKVPSPTATRTTWPVPQLQTFGTDVMWEPPTPTSAAGLDVSRFRLLDVPPPPDMWPLVWISPETVSYRGFLDRSLRLFGSWETTDDVTIPVWADPPTGHTSDTARTVDVDWSDDRYVRFHTDQPGLYYAPSSWHPNWTLTTEGTGPWPAGPNQMIVSADTAGPVEMVWGKHWTESAGQAISAVTLVAALVVSLSTLRRRGVL